MPVSQLCATVEQAHCRRVPATYLRTSLSTTPSVHLQVLQAPFGSIRSVIVDSGQASRAIDGCRSSTKDGLRALSAVPSSAEPADRGHGGMAREAPVPMTAHTR
jgi:hypothetical protein